MQYKPFLITLLLTITFFNVKSQSLLSKDSKEVFTVVEDMPIPWFYKTECIDVATGDKQNCYALKLAEYLIKNLNYPDLAAGNKTEGVVIVQFVVSKDGSIKEPTIIKDIGDGCGEAALKVVREMPTWIPGRQRGVPVNVRYTLPVRFYLKK